MALFPMFVDLKNKECLVVGAGEVALRKIEQLVKFNPSLTVIAPEIHDEIRLLSQEYTITLIERPYVIEDLAGRYLVIGALDDLSEQEKIYTICMEQRIPVNCVDSPALCSFIFPALIVEGDLCVGINTSGRAPAVSSALRQYLTSMIPQGIGGLIDHVHSIRQNEPVGKERQEKIIGVCREFFGRIPIHKKEQDHS
ncbi:precorrin-2 dehydrogenase/sirohydrochlorin ferrochelatase family protein [Sulfuricurvum sp.]|uniref:precorrin-2 dehydrogenase/sirohydrochlorin ferrochelatase family protein n=1 Tax=Sulfuricurvum sp. TaxID=2025608 RepID=UPI003BB120A6